MTAQTPEAHQPTPEEWAQFWYDEDPGLEYRRPIRRARRAMIINPDLLRDGYVDEDEGIWQ